MVMHPVINYDLIKLGIVRDVELIDNKVVLVFAFPFLHIPIADKLINSIARPLKQLDLELEYTVREMTEDEKATFMQLETDGWVG